MSEPRNVARYLIRLLRGESLRRIGEYFQVRKYSLVSSVVERLKVEIVQNRRLRERRERLISRINRSQEQTPSHKTLKKRGNRHSGQAKPCTAWCTGRSATRNPGFSSNCGFRLSPE
ncbi:MAG: hypothetical protein FJ117_09960 [Deltaproteobacteria bacterium]|nr:hypothetical protein [Deltaproteobacteria bacterium]